MTLSRVVVGRDVELVRELPDGVDLMGRIRLRPGSPIELWEPTPGARRKAMVWSWSIANLGNDAPLYRGTCHWA